MVKSMAKGYMVFVEGEASPKMVHPSHKSAFKELHRLADLHPEKEVMLLHLTDRFMRGVGQDKAVSVGTHLPADAHCAVHLSKLISGKSIYEGNRKQKLALAIPKPL